MGKKFVLSDLDGTLLDQPNAISPQYITILNQLIQDGLDFTIATGRDLKNTIKATKGLEFKYPVILTNGALMADMHSQKYLRITSIDPDTVATILQYSQYFDIPPIVFGAYDPEQDQMHFQKGQWGPQGIIPLNWKQIEPLIKFQVVSIQFHTSKLKLDAFYQKCLDILPEKTNIIYIEDVSYAQYGISGEFFWLELNSHQAGKDQMLKYLIESIGRDLKDVIVFGDNHNDISMLKIAGRGIAMENSPLEVRNAAHAVTLSNTAGGVVHYLLAHKSELI